MDTNQRFTCLKALKRHALPVVFLAMWGSAWSQAHHDKQASPLDIPDLITFWDFQRSNEESDLTSQGPYHYTLEEMNGPINRENDGVFGPSSLEIKRGQWLRIEREDCPALDIHGKDEVTIVAWIKRRADNHWQYIAGMWDEGDERFKGKARGEGEGAPARQYALFLNGHKQADYKSLTRSDADNQVHGYVSDSGGATAGKPFSFSYATGGTYIEKDTWYMIAYTYDHEALRVYVNGELDRNGNCNPFYWDKPIHDGGKHGADFTVAQRSVPSWPDYPKGEPGNKVGFGGVLGGLAVYKRALSTEEIKKLYASTLPDQQNQSR